MNKLKLTAVLNKKFTVTEYLEHCKNIVRKSKVFEKWQRSIWICEIVSQKSRKPLL